MTKLKDRIYEWGVTPGSYEQWTLYQAAKAVFAVFIIFLLSPVWMFEVAGRLWRMLKAKIRDGNLERFFKEEAERELKMMEEE